ncbi:MAG TPA: NAD-binding protein [Pyrinomonadaceae bacterium]|nr:NAD-binding protein [Pyrinomonadaceae bacterium]
MGVDFDPQVVRDLRSRDKSIVYGDIEDPDLLEHLPFKSASCIISTVPESAFSLQLYETLQRHDFKGRVFLTALLEKDFELLAGTGHKDIIMPHKMAAEYFYDYLINNVLKDNAGKK